MDLAPAGPLDAITDVPGVRVGHATRDEPGWLTGTTVVCLLYTSPSPRD